MARIIRYNGQVITDYGTTWKHPVTRETPDKNVDPTHFEGVTVEDVPDPEPEPVITPPQPRSWTPLEFLELFPQDLQIAVMSAAQADPVVGLWWAKAVAAREIVENDDRLKQGMAYLVTAGVLTQAQIDEAFA